MFDLYEGDTMEEGKKSIAYSLKYLDPERTLTDEEVTKAHEKVLKLLKKRQEPFYAAKKAEKRCSLRLFDRLGNIFFTMLKRKKPYK